MTIRDRVTGAILQSDNSLVTAQWSKYADRYIEVGSASSAQPHDAQGLRKKSVAELRAIALKNGLQGIEHMKKEELLGLLEPLATLGAAGANAGPVPE